jgi:hypothetical protein
VLKENTHSPRAIGIQPNEEKGITVRKVALIAASIIAASSLGSTGNASETTPTTSQGRPIYSITPRVVLPKPAYWSFSGQGEITWCASVNKIMNGLVANKRLQSKGYRCGDTVRIKFNGETIQTKVHGTSIKYTYLTKRTAKRFPYYRGAGTVYVQLLR